MRMTGRSKRAAVAGALMAATLPMSPWVGAALAQERVYSCAAGDLGYTVTRAVGTGTLVDPEFVIVTFDGGEMVAPEDRTPPFVLPRSTPGFYEGPDGRFSMFDLALTVLPDELTLDCVGDAGGAARTADANVAPGQAMPRSDRGIGVDAFPDAGYGPNSIPDPGYEDATVLEVPGKSFGGTLRAGPDIGSARVGSLREGDSITVIANTGIWWDGYYWFEVLPPSGRGETSFQWGGILCVRGDRVPGASPCTDHWPTDG